MKNQVITPVETSTTTRIIKNGWGGNKPLPVTDFPGGKMVALVLSRTCLKAMMREPSVLSLVLGDDGSISIRAQSIALERTQ